MKKELLIKIGYVMKTHGLKGEVTIKLQPDAPDFKPKNVLMIETDSGCVPYFVEKVSFKGPQVFVKFEEIDTISQSKLLKGRSIFIEKTKRPKLNRNEFYDDELVDLEVWHSKKKIGKVNQVINQGASRFIDVGERNILIPINGPFIKSVLKSKNKIEVDLPDGFLDI